MPMRKIPLIVCLVLASLAGLGGYILAGPWHWLAVLAAISALVALLLPEPDNDVVMMPMAPLSRPTASRVVVRQEADGDVDALRAELEKHKQLERELTAAKQAAEAAMMSKGEFLATMSHEIRTPLNGIIPLLDILHGSKLQDDQREYVRTAYQSARQLLRIVDDILDYSKLEANKLTLETVGVNLRELLDSIMRLMEKQAELKSLGFSLSIDPSVRLAVRSDPVRLRQILTNLLSNAVKFTERGKVELRVSRLGESHDSHHLRFEIIDTGIGLSPDAQAKLFQPFSQADASTTRTFGGTGLGLVICKRIVDLMGGKIGVESVEDRGSTFWFEVQLLKAVGDISQRRKELSGARCLVLTSDAALQRRLFAALPTWGLTPVHSSTTQDAVAKLRAASGRSQSWAFDLLIADLASIRTTAIALQRGVLRESGLNELLVTWLEDDSGNPVNVEEHPRMQFVARHISDADLRRSLTQQFEQDHGADTSESADSAELPASPPPLSGEKLKGHVLLVEDNPVNRQVAQRLLSLSGLTMDVAENGREALERLQAGRYDLVLMDCQMPIMDGYTASRKRRESEQRTGIARIPIIAMTANAMVGDRDKCLQAGMDDYLSKPLNRSLLEQTIRGWLEGGGVRSAGTTESTAAATTTSDRPQLVAVPKATVESSAQPTKNLQANQHLPRATTEVPVSAPPATTATGPALQDDIVEDLREIMGPEFNSLVAVFLEDAPRAIVNLEAAAAIADRNGLIGPAHSLKSTSANLGAMQMSEFAKQIEHGARLGKLDNPVEAVAALSAEFVRVERALRECTASTA